MSENSKDTSAETSEETEFDILDLVDKDDLPVDAADTADSADDAKGDEDGEKGEEAKDEKADEKPDADDGKVDDDAVRDKEEVEKKAKEGDEEASEKKVDEEDKVPDTPTEVEALKTKHLALLDEMSKIAGQAVAAPPPELAKAPFDIPTIKDLEPKVEEEPAKKVELTLTDDEYAVAIESKEGFVNLMNKVIASATPVVDKVDKADAVATAPSVAALSADDINKIINKRLNDARLETEFYQASPDLARYKPLVETVAGEFGKAEKKYNTTGEFFEAVEEEVRKRYGIDKPVVKTVDTKSTNGEEERPAFAKAGQGTRKISAGPSDEVKEMLELMDEED